jgi:hypothetical protein
MEKGQSQRDLFTIAAATRVVERLRQRRYGRGRTLTL